MGKLAVFGMVGTVGFVVDAGILTLLSQVYAVDIYLSRVFSFVAATMVTWLLNRTLVFGNRAANIGKEVNKKINKKSHEYGRYFAVQTGGAMINLSIFSMLIKAFPLLHAIPVIPLGIGSLFGLIFNYSGARYWVFK